jgi:hypothetical protein
MIELDLKWRRVMRGQNGVIDQAASLIPRRSARRAVAK